MTDNPEWGEAEFARARPATEVFTELFGKEGAEKVIKTRGRPKLANPKEPVKLRIDHDVVDAYRAQVMDGKPKWMRHCAIMLKHMGCCDLLGVIFNNQSKLTQRSH